MDAESLPEEQSWLGGNWLLIIFNLIIGAVTFLLIWICTRQQGEEEGVLHERPKKKTSDVKTTTEETCTKETATEDEKTVVPEVEIIKKEIPDKETCVEDISCTVEEVCHQESSIVEVCQELPLEEDSEVDLSPKESIEVETEEKKLIIVDEVVDVIEEVSELHHENEEETIEVAGQDSHESSTDGDGYIVIKQVETCKIIVDTADVDTADVDISEKTVKSTEIISGVTKYEIDVKTGDKSGAGTDANVFIIIYGEHGDTGKIALKNSSTHKHKFEKNHVDTFVEEAANVGKINKIRIGHDNKGGFSGWYLGNVAIDVSELNCKWTFEADRWLDEHEDDKQIEIDICPTLIEETHVETIYADELVGGTETDHKTTISSDTMVGPDGEVIITTTTSEEIHTTTTTVTTDDLIEADKSEDTPPVLVEDVKGKDD